MAHTPYQDSNVCRLYLERFCNIEFSGTVGPNNWCLLVVFCSLLGYFCFVYLGRLLDSISQMTELCRITACKMRI
jgi:hypothetical protein